MIHREYSSSDVSTIDRNVDYRSKCSSMIYDKTNVSQEKPWKLIGRQVWSHLLYSGDGLTKYLQKKQRK